MVCKLFNQETILKIITEKDSCLFYPWKNESVDLIAGSKSYEDSYKKKQKQIEVVCKEYEPYSDVL